jgi:hypothetical protein
MAQFYGDMTGARGTTTRIGSKASGIVAHVRGWNVGVRVRVQVDERTGRDIVCVTRTGGSHAPGDREIIAEFYADDPSIKRVA